MKTSRIFGRFGDSRDEGEGKNPVYNSMPKKLNTTKIDNGLIKRIESVIRAALAYEKATQGKRMLGITGEVGELLACRQLGLQLVLDAQSEGFDAVDKKRLRVQIKSRRSEFGRMIHQKGRTSRFSEHKFDYALLVLLDSKYRLAEIWKASYRRLMPIVEKQKRRNPPLTIFKRVGKRIYNA